MTLPDNQLDVRIAQVRRYVSMVEVMAALGHDLPEATQQIRCPFHDDHSPSARIYPDQNKIYCFTEHKSWDVVDAVQTLHRVSMPEAVAWLERTFQVPSLRETLQGTIRTQLSARMPPQIEPAAQQVEARLKQRRQALGYEAYTRLLMGLDLTVWECTTRRLLPPAALTRFKEILTRAGRD